MNELTVVGRAPEWQRLKPLVINSVSSPITKRVLAPELAAGIQRVKITQSIGVRMGNGLSQKQAQALLNTPDISSLKGLRDRAIIALQLGCGLRQ